MIQAKCELVAASKLVNHTYFPQPWIGRRFGIFEVDPSKVQICLYCSLIIFSILNRAKMKASKKLQTLRGERAKEPFPKVYSPKCKDSNH